MAKILSPDITTPDVGQDTGIPCPTCSSKMLWRKNRTSNSWFMGCTAWPGCSGTRDSSGVSSVIAPHRQNRVWAILKAAIIASEDEALTFTQAQIEEAEQYELHVEEVTEESAYVATVRKK